MKKTYSMRLDSKLVEKARKAGVDITKAATYGIEKLFDQSEIDQGGKYRCSCCNKMKQKDDADWLPWDNRTKTSVAICRACAKEVSKTKSKTVLATIRRLGLRA